MNQAQIVVVGAGPGGLNAALAAAQAGAQVTLVDSNVQPGGQYFRQPASELHHAPTAHQRQGQALWEKVLRAGVQFLSETVVWGAFEGNLLKLHGPRAPASLRAQVIILSTGAYERVAAFPGWTLPGVMTAGAAQTLLKTQRILPGKRILLAGTGPLQFVLAAELSRAGADVAMVLEGNRIVRRGLGQIGLFWRQWARLREGLESGLVLAQHRVPYRIGWGIIAAEGDARVEQATVARLDEDWRPIAGTELKLACDTICLGYGFIPFNTLSSLLGAEQEWRPELGGQVPLRDATMQTSVHGVYAVGDGAGVGGAPLAMLEGEIAGLAAAAQVGASRASAEQAERRLAPRLERERRFQRAYAALFSPGAGLYELGRDDTVVCRCEEITQGQVRRALELGADSATEVKSVTRVGMGNCQGRMCHPILANLMARETGLPVAEVGAFRPRPPVFPVPIGSLEDETAGEAVQ
ncbi:MAG: NAD(P)/FAD-dependent oxidoreductase [Chloroflexi bacterium]|nr:NAD(P)/FAD-dependent oxidoreductase [Chloroflexota bacterium]